MPKYPNGLAGATGGPAGAAGAALCDPPMPMARRCLAPDVWLGPLADRLVRLVLQLV